MQVPASSFSVSISGYYQEEVGNGDIYVEYRGKDFMLL
jgi:hypothetical protein